MEEGKSGLYIVAIVGVIAVVAMVVLVLGASARTSVVPVSTGTSIAGDSAGQVIGMIDPDTFYRLCKRNCGYDSGGDLDKFGTCVNNCIGYAAALRALP